MPRTDINALSDASRIWLFAISPALDETRGAQLLQQVDLFLAGWAAHNVPVTSAREVLHDSFLLIAVDQESETSGCSIDRMFGLLRQLERDLGVAILDPNRVFVRHGDGRVGAMTRDEFRASADPHTVVFDTLAERLGDVRGGRWERPGGRVVARQAAAAERLTLSRSVGLSAQESCPVGSKVDLKRCVD